MKTNISKKVIEEEFSVRDKRRKEKFFVDDQYLNSYAKKCGVTATAVYNSLCRHADKNQKCYPSIKRMAEQHSISARSVYRAINKLEKYNIIRRKRMGKQLTNRYYLLDRIEWTDMTKKTHHTCQKRPITGDKNDISTVRVPNSKGTQKKGDSLVENKKEKMRAYEQGKRWGEKPHHWDRPMVWKKTKNKWCIIEGEGPWLDFNGQPEDVDWR
ncbi:helix-turn-helix domain-containing protein [Patescibacteria group bacterium]|nr:helix-turn-helix domain-containing protein [Patescibacteria group bacterium]